MPDRTALKAGDKIRILRVRKSALRTRERHLREGVEDPGWTVETIKRVIAQRPVVTIDRVDEYGQPWFDCRVKGSNGEVEEHTFAVDEDESWEIATRPQRPRACGALLQVPNQWGNGAGGILNDDLSDFISHRSSGRRRGFAIEQLAGLGSWPALLRRSLRRRMPSACCQIFHSKVTYTNMMTERWIN